MSTGLPQDSPTWFWPERDAFGLRREFAGHEVAKRRSKGLSLAVSEGSKRAGNSLFSEVAGSVRLGLIWVWMLCVTRESMPGLEAKAVSVGESCAETAGAPVMRYSLQLRKPSSPVSVHGALMVAALAKENVSPAAMAAANARHDVTRK